MEDIVATYNQPMRDMPNLDLARSVAVLSVVVEHILLALGVEQLGPFRVEWLGVLGVLVFFVLTCVVLMWSLERKPHTLDFYIRRIFRIYPISTLVLVVAVLCHSPTGGTPEHYFAYNAPTVRSFVLQVLLLTRVWPLLISVMWTLPYEMAMYFLLPVLYFFVRKNFSVWPLMVLWTLTLLLAHSVPSDGHTFGVAIGYFLPGVMAYVGFERWKPRLPGWLLPVFLAALWMVFWHHANYHRGWFFCLIFGLGLPQFRQIKATAVVLPSRVIARYSYGIYLTHPFAIVVGLYLLRGRPGWVQGVVMAALLVMLPVVAYHLIEHPMIRLGSRLAKRAEHRFVQQAQVAPGA